MERFCSSNLPYWDLNLTWNTENPDFTVCFHETSLIWTPCLFFLLLFPYHLIWALRKACKQNTGKSGKQSDINHQTDESASKGGSNLQSNDSPVRKPNRQLIIGNVPTKTPRNSISSALSHSELINLTSNQTNHNCLGCLCFRLLCCPFRRSILGGIKKILTILLIAISLTEFVYCCMKSNEISEQILFYRVTPIVKTIIFCMTLWLQHIHTKYRVVVSFSLFLYWLLFLLQSLLNTWSIFRINLYYETNQYDINFYNYSTFVLLKLATNLLIILEFICSLFAELAVLDYIKYKQDDSTADANSINEENKNSPTNTDSQITPKNPQYSSSILSRIIFLWTFSIIWKGFRKPLTLKQIWPLQKSNCTAVNVLHFSHNYRIRTQKNYENDIKKKICSPNLIWSLILTYWPQLLFNAFLKLALSFLPYLNTMFLSWLITFVDEGHKQEPNWHGFLYVILMFITPMTESFINGQYSLNIGLISLRMRSCIINTIYCKSLRLSSSGRQQFTIGEIVNLMALDSNRISEFVLILNDTWSSPLQIIIAIYLLYLQLGLASLSALVTMILILPINSFVTSKMRFITNYLMRYKDKRIKLMNEILSGIKVLKLYAWEDSFSRQVLLRRYHELNQLKQRIYYQTALIFIFNSAPFLITITSFATFVFLNPDNRLDPQKAFVSLSLVNQLRIPFNNIPKLIAFYAMFVVSLNRIKRYMNGDELNFDSIEKKPMKYDYDVKIDDGTFAWSFDDDLQVQSKKKSKQGRLHKIFKTKQKPENIIEEYCKSSTLRNINIKIRKESLVAIVGQVGSGKSSLLNALLGNMYKLKGTVKINNSISYVAQQAWIQNATLRENILCQNTLDEDKLAKIINACALRPDIEMLPGGEHTEIGERGINISGGQKQRIAIARACYAEAALYLFDDPLSALDAHVGQYIFDRVIGPKGLLRHFTRVLVTHRISVLPQCDYIYVIKDGEVVDSGTYSQLMSNKGSSNFSEFLQTHLVQDDVNENENNIDNLHHFHEQADLDNSESNFSADADDEAEDDEACKINKNQKELQSMNINQNYKSSDSNNSLDKTEQYLQDWFTEIDDISINSSISIPDSPIDLRLENVLSENNQTSNEALMQTVQQSNLLSQTVSVKEIDLKSEPNTKDFSKLTTIEQSATGSVKFSHYWAYFQRIGLFNVFLVLLFQIATLACNIGASQWLSLWSNSSPGDNLLYLFVYIVLGLLECVFIFLSALTLSLATLNGAKRLHDDMLRQLLRAPSEFFDTNPLGRILNRFSRDIDICDTMLNMNLRITMFHIFRTFAAIMVIAIDAWYVMVAVIPLGMLYYALQKLYIPTSRQLRRIESVTRSPIYSHFAETITGSSTIRAFDKVNQFVQKSDHKLDVNNRSAYATIVTGQWLSIHLEFLGYMVVFANALYSVLQRGQIQASTVGLTMSYSLTITRYLNRLIQGTSSLETNIVSVERCIEYINITTEADYTKTESPLKNNQEEWPREGRIEFRNYSTRYQKGLDLVLRSINFVIESGQRVGVVGRTGAGKSSLTLALFRIIEPAEGTILIDNIDIKEIGLYDLRSRLTIIPQDPVLFTGTLRFNLDPFENFSDDEIWSALEMANLKSFVLELNCALDHQIVEGGENLSVGQKQLVCLARAVLRRTKILVLDEATAAVDIETDELIQNTIRSQFANCTIFTIAHRINTIIDYDRILVVDNGTVAEYDTPQTLLQTSTSLFRSMAIQAGVFSPS